jgi:Flp pilus assembly protein TadD
MSIEVVDESFRRLFNFVLPLPESLPGVSGELFLRPFSSGDWAGAVAFYQGLRRLYPADGCLDNALAGVFFNLGDDERALDLLLELVKREPTNPVWLNNLGVVCGMRRECETGMALLEQAGRLVATAAAGNDIISNRSCLEMLSGRPEAARQGLLELLSRDPDHRRALYLLGRLSLEMGWLEEAEKCCRKLVELVPTEAEYRQNLGFVLLKQGRWEEGLALYEARWEVAGRHLPHPDRLWRGESLAGRSLLVWAEQGFGDTLNFARFLPLLQEQSGLLRVAVQPSLVGLFRASFPGIEIVTLLERDRLEFDYHLPFMSLPRFFQVRPDLVPGKCPYLRVLAAEQEKWRRRLPVEVGNEACLRVGLVWSSNPRNVKLRGRSLPASFLPVLFSLAGKRFYLLQKEMPPEDRRLLEQLPPLRERVVDLSLELETFQDTAAILRQLDLLISVDTSVPHLAGALGVPTWLLLPYNADWRWLTEGEDTVWYPQMRLFRQPRPGDWQSVLGQVTHELCAEKSVRQIR